MATEPDWLTRARNYIGQAEVSGPRSNSWIREMWLRLKGGAWYWAHFGSDDSRLPWCGAFCARVMGDSGFAYPKNYASAKAWLDWGVTLESPVVGCIVVYERKGGGHVGFVIGKDRDYRLLTLGGNQGDAVSVMAFPQSRALGFRWPTEALAQLKHEPLPVIRKPVAVSTSEA